MTAEAALAEALAGFRRLAVPSITGLPDVGGADLDLLEEAARVAAAADRAGAGAPVAPADLACDRGIDARLAAAVPASTRERAALERWRAYRDAVTALAGRARAATAMPGTRD